MNYLPIYVYVLVNQRDNNSFDVSFSKPNSSILSLIDSVEEHSKIIKSTKTTTTTYSIKNGKYKFNTYLIDEIHLKKNGSSLLHYMTRMLMMSKEMLAVKSSLHRSYEDQILTTQQLYDCYKEHNEQILNTYCLVADYENVVKELLYIQNKLLELLHFYTFI